MQQRAIICYENLEQFIVRNEVFLGIVFVKLYLLLLKGETGWLFYPTDHDKKKHFFPNSIVVRFLNSFLALV